MRKHLHTPLSVVTILILLMPFSIHAMTVNVTPTRVEQGDPIMITVLGTTSTHITHASITNMALHFFTYKNTPTALYGVDINQQIGTTSVTVTFADNSQATTSFLITTRERPGEFLPVPIQLGGNSAINQAKILATLNAENSQLAKIFSRTDKILWTSIGTSTFSFPVASSTETPLVVTDSYGYSRNSGVETITHKGVDFRAIPGTPIYAINRGVVRTAKKFTVYGNTVVIDHGLGLLSMYMHLSKIFVYPGQLVSKNQLIGLSGETGYSEGAHLHLSIRIGGVSIDPIKFFNLF